MTSGSQNGATSQSARDCLVCRTPLAGALGAFGRAAGIRRSTQNPNLCNRCDAHMQDGRIIEVGVLFADLTGFTPLTARLGPERTYELVDAFLRSAKETIVKWDGFVTQFAGDEVMALFNVPIGQEDFARRAVAAASEIQDRMPELSSDLGEDLRATIGIAEGHARVGRLGSNNIKDYSAIGDVVNRAARLVARAEPGDILVDAGVFEGVREQFPNAPQERVSLKGFDEPVEVVSLGSGQLPADDSTTTIPGPRSFRIGLLLAAVLGAPCAGLMVMTPLLVGAGIGATGVAGAAIALDQTAVRLPLLLLATAAALANLAGIAWSRRSRTGFEIASAGPAGLLGQGRAGQLGIVASFSALSMVVFELLAHAMMH